MVLVAGITRVHFRPLPLKLTVETRHCEAGLERPSHVAMCVAGGVPGRVNVMRTSLLEYYCTGTQRRAARSAARKVERWIAFRVLLGVVRTCSRVDLVIEGDLKGFRLVRDEGSTTAYTRCQAEDDTDEVTSRLRSPSGGLHPSKACVLRNDGSSPGPTATASSQRSFESASEQGTAALGRWEPYGKRNTLLKANGWNSYFQLHINGTLEDEINEPPRRRGEKTYGNQKREDRRPETRATHANAPREDASNWRTSMTEAMGKLRPQTRREGSRGHRGHPRRSTQVAVIGLFCLGKKNDTHYHGISDDIAHQRKFCDELSRTRTRRVKKWLRDIPIHSSPGTRPEPEPSRREEDAD
ncbi:hypothetical protein C8R46DRAFT_1023653 [Mycena filopes]|nr:hypothetical protein C8R46DRAFT_1023653 [Mycena filopes]